MFEVIKSATFDDWLKHLRDVRARARINARITRMQAGHLGDAKPLGDGLYEARIFYGPGYRLYFIRHGRDMIVLLCGGDKGSQSRYIEKARRLAMEWRSGNE